MMRQGKSFLLNTGIKIYKEQRIASPAEMAGLKGELIPITFSQTRTGNRPICVETGEFLESCGQ